MDAVSTSSKFFNMDLPLMKPCCLGRTHESKMLSQLFRAALAMSLLSVLTMLRGRVLAALYAGVPSGVVVWAFFGRHAMIL